MQFNLQPRVRLAVYVVNGLGSIVVTYLSTKGKIGDPEVVAWTAYTVFSSSLAALNVDRSK